MRRKVLSIDAETNGLWGEAFAIAATLHEHWEGTETKYFMEGAQLKAKLTLGWRKMSFHKYRD